MIHRDSEPTRVDELGAATRRMVASMAPAVAAFDHSDEVDPSVETRLRDLGYFGLTIPEEYGGLGLRCIESMAVLEHLAALPLCFYTAVRTGASLGSRMLVRFGSESQKRRWLPGIAAGAVTTAVAMTEPGAGSDLGSIRTTATRGGSTFRVTGTKHFITNGHRADILTLFARSSANPEGLSCLVVEKGSPGFSVRSMQRSMSGPPDVLAVLDFDDCVVPAENLIGAEGGALELAKQVLDEGRLAVAATCVGMAQAALELARVATRDRHAFGQPVAGFQAIRHALADMAIEIEAARALLSRTCSRFDDGADVRIEAAMTKVFASEAAHRVIDSALQLHGGSGYMKGVAVERLYREIRVMRILEGTSEVLRGVIGTSLVREGSA